MEETFNYKGAHLDETNEKIKPDGIHHLLVIAIDEYQWMGKLKNCVKDAQDLIEVLTQKYRFSLDHVKKIFDRDATRENILETLRDYRQKINPNDTLMIYFSGHGEVEDNVGYWVPVEAKKDIPAQYISTFDIKHRLDLIDSFHTLVVIDACFAGTIFLGPKNSNPGNDSNPSRWGFASSDDRNLALDGLPGNNSPFATSLLKHLRQNEEDIGLHRLASNVIDDMRRFNQRPICQPLNVKGHDLGQFVFRLRGQNTFVDNRDGKVYRTIEVNGKLWMAQNLDYDVGNECYYYAGDERLGPFYGRLYSWDAAKEACPPGWRLPTIIEWEEFVISQGGYRYHKDIFWTPNSNDYKSEGDWATTGDSEVAYNSLVLGKGSEFNAILGGIAVANDTFQSLGFKSFYWSSSPVSNDSDFVHRRVVIWGIEFSKYFDLETDKFRGDVELSFENRYFGCSCRCVKDNVE